MKNNFYNIPDNWYKEFNNTFNPVNMNLTKNITNPKEGFLRGNLFNNLYDPYKNYKYGSLNPSNKKEELLFNLLMYKFALTELNLYLDNYPNNTEILNLYNKYLFEEKQLCNQYEKQYGPLTTGSENINTNNWDWNKSPWPWEGTK